MISVCGVAIFCTSTCMAQSDNTTKAAPEETAQSIIIEPLFNYPVAPDNLTDLRQRTNYLMEHFWEGMNFKSKKAVDQNALNDAFSVYTSAIPYSDKAVVDLSVNSLLKNLSKNPVLLYQFTKAAEDNLYGDRAQVWIDEVYLKFLREISKNKKISQSRKIRYADQLKRLENSIVGSKIISFGIKGVDGAAKQWTPSAPLNIIEFGSPDCEDCRRARILLDVNLPFLDLLEEGKLSMTFVVVEDDPDGLLMEATKNYSGSWQVGLNPEISEIIDLRSSPSFYIVDGEGKIIAKNLDVNSLLNFVKSEREKVTATN